MLFRHHGCYFYLSRNNKMDCRLPCYKQPKFDYASISCYLKRNSIKTDRSINVVYMVKDQQTGGFVYREKPVLYFVPRDSNSRTALAYLIPGHSDNYVYMYMLSVPLGDRTYSGEHFTFGDKPNGGFDLHYTTYDYVSGNKPYHIYYDLKIKQNTTPEDISKIVCNKRGSSSREELTNRCYFFDSVMQAIHAGSCEGNFDKAYQMVQGATPVGGAKKQTARKQKLHKGGSDGDEDILENALSEVLATVPNLTQVEIHVMPKMKGMLTFFLQNEVDAIVVNDDGSSRASKHNTAIPYAFPYDFATNEFMSLDEFVSTLNSKHAYGSSSKKAEWWRRSILDVCPTDILSLYFSDTTRSRKKQGCGLEATMDMPAQKVFFTSLPTIAGGKSKTERKKLNKTSSKSKSIKK